MTHSNRAYSSGWPGLVGFDGSSLIVNTIIDAKAQRSSFIEGVQSGENHDCDPFPRLSVAQCAEEGITL